MKKNNIGTTMILLLATADLLVDKKTDIKLIDPRKIKLNPNNHRNIDINSVDMRILLASVKANGIITPLMIKPNPNFGVNGDNHEYIAYAGNRRSTVLHYLLENIDNTDVVSAEERESVLERISRVKCQYKAHVPLELELTTQAVENSAQPFSFLEKAGLVSQLVNECGLTPAQVEEKTGEPQSMISNYLTVSKWSEKHKKMIADNDISAQLAIQIARDSETTEEFEKRMDELAEKAKEIKAQGGKRTKRAVLTAKNVDVQAEKNPKKILQKVWLKLEKNGYQGKDMDLLFEMNKLLLKPNKNTVNAIYKLFAKD